MEEINEVERSLMCLSQCGARISNIANTVCSPGLSDVSIMLTKIFSTMIIDFF